MAINNLAATPPDALLRPLCCYRIAGKKALSGGIPGMAAMALQASLFPSYLSPYCCRFSPLRRANTPCSCLQWHTK